MAYRLEKTQGGQDLVIDGFEQGVAASPHKGIANIQNGNISTEIGEVMASFNRTAQLTSASALSSSGTLTASAGDGNYVLASDVAMNVGQWIHVTAATVQVPKTTETVSVLAVGGGGGGGGATGQGSAGGGGGGGQVSSDSAFGVSATSYTITIGAKGTGGASGANGTAGGTTTITHVSGVTITTDKTAVGGGYGAGGQGTLTAGGTGASGGGGAGGFSSTPTTSSGGSSSIGGFGGGNGALSGNDASGGGGGGTSSAGANGTAGGGTATGGNGGSGTASSISGTSTTYGSGGGGGAGSAVSDPVTGGTAGTGGGNGGANADGSPATANTGSGGGGGGRNTAGSQSGGDGADGVVIISYPTGNLTATGGTITTSGGNTIHTFTSSGTFTISAINTTQNLPTGYYFVDYSASSGTKVKIASSYDPSGSNPKYHGTSGTITFTCVGAVGKGVARATETYNNGTTTYHRYYILDSQGLVWVNDSANSLNWVLTRYDTTFFGSSAAPSGLAVLNGMLLVFAGELIYAKPTTNLGTTWVQVANDIYGNNLSSSTIPHFAYVGHQGRCYYTDGNFIGEIFPDSSLQTGGANVQSYASLTGTTTQGTITAILSGSAPQVPIGTSYRIPAVFFTDDFGTMPTDLTAGVVYWIDAYNASTGTFTLYGASASTNETLTSSLSSGATSATLSASWTGATMVQPVAFSNGDVRPAQFTANSTALTWTTGLSGSATSTITIGRDAVDLATGASGNLYFNTFYPLSGSNAASGGALSTTTLTNQRLYLPTFEIAQCITEIGNTVLIGCKGNVVYPWNQQDSLPSGIISLPESDTVSLLTVNQMAYIFTGHKGNVYITDGSVATQVIKVPDYAVGVPGSPATYIEPYFTWGDTMYMRGRVYFSILDQTSTKAGNCGGIWSFIPTQNFYIGQDIGMALRLENENSYGTYNGYATILIGREDQTAGHPLYWSAWWADISGTSYGIDYSNSGTSSSFTTVIETDAIPVGTFLNKATDSNIEYKLGSPLDAGATVTFKYRGNLTDAWTDGNTFSTETTGISGLAKVNFQKLQWLQLQFTLTPITSTASTNTFVRLREIRIR